MVRPAFVALLVAALGLAGASLAFTAASRARAGRAATSSAAPVAGVSVPESPPSRPARPAVPPPAEVLRVRPGRSVALRDRPRGHVIARIGDRTEFGSTTALSVAARHGRWAGVPSPALGNGRLGWIDARGGALERRTTRVRLAVDLSKRRLELRVRGRVVRRVAVAIGRPGSATPTGRFSITDKLAGGQYGPYYGCCILALSGHQPHPPPGWQGGSRLAIHGTNAPSTIGTPSSAGCLRAADDDLRALMRRVPLGAPVRIRK